MPWPPSWILGRLQEFVKNVCSDPVFRRRVRYAPAEALTSCGFDPSQAPAQLRVKHYEVSTYLDEPTLFGVGASFDSSLRVPVSLRLVAYGAKPLGLFHGPEKEMTSLALWARQHRLVAVLSPHEFTPVADGMKAGYSNLAADRKPARAASGAWRGLLIGPDANEVMLGWLSLLFQWDHYLGKLLGYPPCCVEAFEKRWPEACRSYGGDLASMLAEDPAIMNPAGPFHWGTNNFSRYFHYSLTEHFPCGFECTNSEAVAEEMLQVLTRFEPKEASSILKFLCAAVVVSKTDGVILLPEAEVLPTEGRVRFDRRRCRMTLPTSPLAVAMKTTDHICVRTDGIEVGKRRFSGRLIHFAARRGPLPPAHHHHVESRKEILCVT